MVIVLKLNNKWVTFALTRRRPVVLLKEQMFAFSQVSQCFKHKLLITQVLLKVPKKPFVRRTLLWVCNFSNSILQDRNELSADFLQEWWVWARSTFKLNDLWHIDLATSDFLKEFSRAQSSVSARHKKAVAFTRVSEFLQVHDFLVDLGFADHFNK